MSFLHDRLRVSHEPAEKHQTNLTLCSFFCNSRSEASTDARLALRRILWELLSKRHDLISHATPYFDEYSQWSLETLWRVLEAVMTDSKAREIVVIMDGLDECSNLMKSNFFDRLASCLEHLRSLSRTTIRFVLSSRSVTAEERPELHSLSTSLRLDENRSVRTRVHQDIERYVQSILARLYRQYRINEDRIPTIAGYIATRSEGSFLWAVLVMEEAERQFYSGNEEHLTKILEECPSKLEGIYYKALQHVDYHRVKIRESFGLILAAKRPLTISEFQAALAVDSDHDTLRDVQSSREDDASFLMYLRNNLGLFIHIDTATITYRHDSVKDFVFNKLPALQRQHSQEHGSDFAYWLDLSEEQAETIMAKSCMSFLKLEDFAKSKRESDVLADLWEDAGFANMQLEGDFSPQPSSSPVVIGLDQETRMSSIPFFEYAASHWFQHVAETESFIEEIMLLLSRRELMVNWTSMFRKNYSGSDKLPEEPDALLLAAYFGHVGLFKRLFSRPEVDASRERALTWASRLGRFDIVKFSVELGTPFREDYLDGMTSFSWAVQEGCLDIVKYLLHRDQSLVNILDDKGASPLLLAVSWGHLSMVKLLLRTDGVDISLCNKYGQSPIHLTFHGPIVTTSERAILQLLLDKPKFDITARSNAGRTVLWFAADVGASQVLTMLLQQKSRTDAVKELLQDAGDDEGQSPLARAVFNGHLDFIRLLFDPKKIGKDKIQAQLQSIDRDGDNAFGVAAKRSQARVIDVLSVYYPEGVDHQDHTGV